MEDYPEARGVKRRVSMPPQESFFFIAVFPFPYLFLIYVLVKTQKTTCLHAAFHPVYSGQNLICIFVHESVADRFENDFDIE